MNLLLTSLPDELATWHGSAKELAEKYNELLPRLNLEKDEGSVNVRLVHYYVAEKVLTPPEREGPNAGFGFRQLVELLVTRYLLRDGWRLAKIAAMVQSADLESLQHLVPGDRPRTSAEEAVARIRMAGEPPPSFQLAPMASPPRPSQRSLSLKPDLSASVPDAALARAAELTRRKSALTDNLKALGNAAGRPARRRVVRLELTPWCEVYINAAEFHDISEDDIEVLGAALTHALMEERAKKGEKQ